MSTIRYLSSGENRYQINNVTYFVGSRFPEAGDSFRSRLEHIIQNNMTDLMNPPPHDTMSERYVHSVIGKEEE